MSACPPYRIVFVIGGQSPEQTTLAAKLATTGALDALPSKPGANGGPFRDRVLEKTIVELAAASGWGAQFGGRLMARDARVIWLPRHAASLPVVLDVSCSAHRQMYGHIGPDGYFLEHLADGSELASIKAEIQSSFGLTALASSPDGRAIADTPAADSPSLGIPTPDRTTLEVLDSEQLARKDTLSFRRVDIDSLNPANLVCGEFVELWGPIVVARDAAHARLSNLIKAGQTLPEWTSKAVFYAGPTETPDGEIIGSIGPTTSKRMDGYLDELMARGAFVVSLGKGERSSACKDACARYKGAYLVTLGGAAATAARKYVSSVTVLAWPELGMEAVRLINLTGLPAMVAVDSEGRDFYAGLRDSQRL